MNIHNNLLRNLLWESQLLAPALLLQNHGTLLLKTEDLSYQERECSPVLQRSGIWCPLEERWRRLSWWLVTLSVISLSCCSRCMHSGWATGAADITQFLSRAGMCTGIFTLLHGLSMLQMNHVVWRLMQPRRVDMLIVPAPQQISRSLMLHLTASQFLYVNFCMFLYSRWNESYKWG